MNQSITIIDADYKQWLKELVMRYRNSQIKAALKVNTEQLFFNLSLGKKTLPNDKQKTNTALVSMPH